MATVTRAPGVSGTVVRQHLLVMRERFGAEIVDLAMADVTDEQRRALDAALPVEWVPLSSFDAFYASLGMVLRRSVGDLHREVGREATERTLRTVWRLLLKLTTDEALVARTPILYAKTFDTGTLGAAITGPGTAVLTLTGWPHAPEFVRRGLGVGISTVLTVAGRKGATVTSQPTTDGASFAVSWQR